MGLTFLIVAVSSVAAIPAVLLIAAAGRPAAGRLASAACTKRINVRHPLDHAAGASARVHMADIRERLHRLETIAAEFEV